MGNFTPITRPAQKSLIQNFYMQMLPKEDSNAYRLSDMASFNIHSAKGNQLFDADGNNVGYVQSGSISLFRTDADGNLKQVGLYDDEDGNYDRILLEHGYANNGFIFYNSSADNGVYDQQDVHTYGKEMKRNVSKNGF